MDGRLTRCFLGALILLAFSRCQEFPDSCPQDRSYVEEGDINIGGLIPLHVEQPFSDPACGRLRSVRALREVEAMVYAVRRANRDDAILPGVRLGFHIRDTCYSVPEALRSCLNFVPDNRCAARRRLGRIAGVVGARRSSCSEQVATLLGLYRIPQVSYLSTSDVLSNRFRYPYFLRTVSPDAFQVAALVDLLVAFDWRYVTFISSDDVYGHGGQQEFQRRSADSGVCTSRSSYRTVSPFVEEAGLDGLILDLLALQGEAGAVVVVLFVDQGLARRIFGAAERVGARRRFVWVGSDGWGNYGEAAILGYEEIAVGAFTISPLSSRLEAFDEYFHSLNTSSNNPWLGEFLEVYAGCVANATEARAAGRPSCDEPGLVRQIDDGKVSHESLVMDSVFSFAYALDSMRRDLCPDTARGLCPNMTQIDGDVLLRYLKATAFESLANGWISFTDEGNMYGRYAINHLQWNESSQTYGFRRVGEWKQSLSAKIPNLQIDSGLPWYLWSGASVDPSTGVPRSICSDPCRPGEKINRIPDNLCCWTCTACEASEIVAGNGTECESCIDVAGARFAWPNANQTECVDIPSDFVLAQQAWALAILAVAVVCISATLFTMAVYIFNREMPLIKASSRELSYIIFLGILLSYVTAIVFSVAPSPFVCVLRRLGPSVATSFIYASIATKTVRLFRIFRASKKSAKRPNYIGPMFQVVLSLSISSLAAAWTVVWLIVDPPEVVLTMPDEREKKLQVTCKLNIVETVGVMAWDVGLVVICCVFAFMTRKLPENYNETRFITFCSFCTLVVFVTFSPIYFTSEEPYYQASYYSAGLIINATVTLTCLFAIKIYALYFVDEEEMNIFTQTRLRANTKTASARGVPPPSCSSQNEVHHNPSYVTETGRYASAEPGDEEPDAPANSGGGGGVKTASAGVMERLRGNNKIDPSSGAPDSAKANGITDAALGQRDAALSGPNSPQAKEAKVFFSPDLVESDTHM